MPDSYIDPITAITGYQEGSPEYQAARNRLNQPVDNTPSIGEWQPTLDTTKQNVVENAMSALPGNVLSTAERLATAAPQQSDPNLLNYRMSKEQEAAAYPQLQQPVAQPAPHAAAFAQFDQQNEQANAMQNNFPGLDQLTASMQANAAQQAPAPIPQQPQMQEKTQLTPYGYVIGKTPIEQDPQLQQAAAALQDTKQRLANISQTQQIPDLAPEIKEASGRYANKLQDQHNQIQSFIQNRLMQLANPNSMGRIPRASNYGQLMGIQQAMNVRREMQAPQLAALGELGRMDMNELNRQIQQEHYGNMLQLGQERMGFQQQLGSANYALKQQQNAFNQAASQQEMKHQADMYDLKAQNAASLAEARQLKQQADTYRQQAAQPMKDLDYAAKSYELGQKMGNDRANTAQEDVLSQLGEFAYHTDPKTQKQTLSPIASAWLNRIKSTPMAEGDTTESYYSKTRPTALLKSSIQAKLADPTVPNAMKFHYKTMLDSFSQGQATGTLQKD